jgi:glycosyltransferase involved in cell wall biosynthesis
MDLTVVIPTRNPRAVLTEALARLERQTGGVRFDVLIVDDGSDDGARDTLRSLVAETSLDATLLEQGPLGPAAARNRAIAATSSPVCLFMDDDSWARPDLLARHRDFHVRNPDDASALLGGLVVPASPPPTPFMRWLGDALFDYASIDDPHDVGGARFYASNVSAKTALLRRTGGFDEDFPSAAYEDLDLGLRLDRHGLRLAYDAAAVAEHGHPIDLTGAIARLMVRGRAMAPFVERHPEWPVPRPPALRHRVKAATLTGLAAMRVRTPRLQNETWRFLCHEASREGYWAAVERREPLGRAPGELRIGGRLARLASRDADARMPAGHEA